MGSFVLTDDEKVLCARIGDFIQRCEKENTPVFTEFLSDREKAICLEAYAEKRSDIVSVAFGGYEEAERTVIGFFPEYSIYMEKEELLRDFPIEALKIECSGFREHNHRDFLGSILGLGLERSLIGDIIVGEKGYYATVFVLKRIALFITENLKLVGRDGVRIYAQSPESVSIVRSFEKISGTVASLRIDAFLSEILNISRDKAVRLIEAELVCLNHGTVSDKSKDISEQDVISVRGFGKYRLSKVGDTNRKGRIRFEAEKYI